MKFIDGIAVPDQTLDEVVVVINGTISNLRLERRELQDKIKELESENKRLRLANELADDLSSAIGRLVLRVSHIPQKDTGAE